MNVPINPAMAHHVMACEQLPPESITPLHLLRLLFLWKCCISFFALLVGGLFMREHLTRAMPRRSVGHDGRVGELVFAKPRAFMAQRTSALGEKIEPGDDLFYGPREPQVLQCLSSA